MGRKETKVAVSNGSGGEGEGGSETKVCVWRVAGSGGRRGMKGAGRGEGRGAERKHGV